MSALLFPIKIYFLPHTHTQTKPGAIGTNKRTVETKQHNMSYDKSWRSWKLTTMLDGTTSSPPTCKSVDEADTTKRHPPQGIHPFTANNLNVYERRPSPRSGKMNNCNYFYDLSWSGGTAGGMEKYIWTSG